MQWLEPNARRGAGVELKPAAEGDGKPKRQSFWYGMAYALLALFEARVNRYAMKAKFPENPERPDRRK